MWDWAVQGPRDNYEPDAMRESEPERAEEEDSEEGPDFDCSAAFADAEKPALGSKALHSLSASVLNTIENKAATVQHTAMEALHDTKSVILTVARDSKLISDATLGVAGVTASSALHLGTTAAAGATAAVEGTVVATAAAGTQVGTHMGAAAAGAGAMAGSTGNALWNAITRLESAEDGPMTASGSQPPEITLTPEEIVKASKRFRQGIA
jgi:hypothetical protein